MSYDCLTPEQQETVDALMLVGDNKGIAKICKVGEQAVKHRLSGIFRAYGINPNLWEPRIRLAYLRARELSLLAVCLFVLVIGCKAQASCPAPTPGTPHVCLKWTASTTAGATYNIFRATTSGGQNYATPLNSAPISGTSFYDTTAAIGTTYFYTALAVGTGGATSLPTSEASSLVPVPPASATAFSASID